MKRGRVWGAAALSWLLMQAAYAIPRAVTSTLTTMRDAMFGLICYFPTLDIPNSHSSYRACISEYVYACALLLITNDGRSLR